MSTKLSAVNYALTDEQVMLRESVANYLRDKCGAGRRLELAQASPSAMRVRWRDLAQELGIQGATFPKQFGGFGGGRLETMVIMEEFGKALATDPFLECVVLAGRVLKSSDSPAAADLIPAIIDGSAIVVVAHAEPDSRFNISSVRTVARTVTAGFQITGKKAVVAHAPCASHLIVSARITGEVRSSQGISLFLIPADHPNLGRRDYKTVDGRWASELNFDELFIPQSRHISNLGNAFEIMSTAINDATLGVCAEAVGCMRTMLAQTVEYSKQRHQFGRPISSFQVLKHAMVDMLVAVELAAAITHRAALADDCSSSGDQFISAAKVRVSQSARIISQNAVQIHGAIGTTQELELSGYFKRLMIIESQFGSADYHLAQYAKFRRDNIRSARD